MAAIPPSEATTFALVAPDLPVGLKRLIEINFKREQLNRYHHA
jgi:hypothetical protein